MSTLRPHGVWEDDADAITIETIVLMKELVRVIRIRIRKRIKAIIEFGSLTSNTCMRKNSKD